MQSLGIYHMGKELNDMVMRKHLNNLTSRMKKIAKTLATKKLHIELPTIAKTMIRKRTIRNYEK